MPETLYDTRFFIYLLTAKDVTIARRLKSELDTRKRRYVSAVTVHEVYRLSLQDEGRDVARMRRSSIERDFQVIDVNSDIAVEAAEIKVAQGSDFPLADAIIGATAVLRRLECFTDDDHLKKLEKVKTRWI
ncbi:MAG: PIN domain-containing protein [Candidatus Bathyarchaeia archaeon]|jgi:predicted nucleic acid-binding protein